MHPQPDATTARSDLSGLSGKPGSLVFDRCCPVSPLRVIRESVSNDWIKDSENPNIQTGRSQNCQYLQNGLSRDSTSSRQWMNFWLRQLCRRWGTTTGTCAARWCCLPSSPDWSPMRRSTTWHRNSSTSICPAKLFPLGYLLFCRLLLMQIAKVGSFMKNSGNLLQDRHKNFENWFRNSWDNWGQSWHLQHRNYFLDAV